MVVQSSILRPDFRITRAMNIIASAQYRGLNIVVKEWPDSGAVVTVTIYGPCVDYGDYHWSAGRGWESASAKSSGVILPCALPDGLDEGPAILAWLNSGFRNTMDLKEFLLATLGPDRT